MRFGGHDDRDRLLAIFCSVDADVCDNGCGAVDRLELLERNVLSSKCLNQVLLAVNDADFTVGVELSNVTSLEPSVVGEGLLGLLGHVQVTVYNTTATDPDFSLRRVVGGEVAGIREVDKLHLD